MENYKNPLIQEDVVDTLTNVRQVLSLLEDFHLNASAPDANSQKDSHCGLFWVLRCTKQALDMELERIDKKQPTTSE